MKTFQFVIYSILTLAFGQTPLLSQNREISNFWEKHCDLPKFGSDNNSLNNIIINNEGVIFGIKEKYDLYSFLYRSIDNGATWQDISNNLPIAVDSEFEGMVNIPGYKPIMDEGRRSGVKISLWGDYLLLFNGDNNMVGEFTWLSRDNGNSWELIKNKKTYKIYYIFSKTVKDLIIEYYYDKTYHVKKSTDFGKTWKEISEKEFEEICLSEIKIKEVEYKSNDKNIPNPNGFIELFNYSNDDKWYLKEDFLKLPKNNDPNIFVQVGNFDNTPSKKYCFVNVFYDNDIFRLGGLNSSKNLSSYEKNWYICTKLSNNQWKTVSKTRVSFDYRNELIAIDCNDNVYAYIDYPKKIGFCKSSDGGITWNTLPIKPFDRLDFNSLNHDGRFYIPHKGTLYRSKEKIDCGISPSQEPETKIKFGTTVITHGYQLGGVPPTNQSDWTFQMALAIVKKHGKGTVKTYQKSTGRFKTDTEVGVGGETVLLFDWAAESDDNSHGYSEAAGDALFAALMMEQKKSKLENLHLIGHSRGAVVNSECVLRLLSAGVAVDHVTYLDPHDWGVGTIATQTDDDFDVHPEFNPIPGIANSHQAVVGWSGVGFCDTYYQNSGWESPFPDCGTCVGGLEGRDIRGSNSTLWNYYGKNKICHSNIHSCGYTNSVISPNAVIDKEGGYKYARLGGNERPPLSDAQSIPIDADFFFGIYNLKRPDGIPYQRIKGIMNGSFDRGINEYSQNLPTTPGGQPQGYYYALLPGWQYHGGSNPSESVEYKTDHIVLSNSLTSKNSKSLLRHNRFFVPKDAKAIAFKYKSLKSEKGKINIKIQSQTSLKNRESSINLEKINPSFIEHNINVSEFSQDVITLEFELISTGNGNLSIALDDIRFDKNKSTFSTNSNQPSEKVEIVVDNNIQNLNPHIRYGTIKTLQGSNLNIRSDPSDKATIINKAPNGEKVKILGEDDKRVTVNGEKGKWLKIEYGGKIGWAWGNFIEKQ